MLQHRGKAYWKIIIDNLVSSGIGPFPSERAALLGDRRIGPEEVTRLAELPSRDVLIAQVLGGMKGPMAGLVNVLNGVTRNLVGVLDARRQQLEEGNAA